MNFKSLLAQADLRPISSADLGMPSLPGDGRRLLDELCRRFAPDRAAYLRPSRIDSGLEISSQAGASAPWYADRRIRLLVRDGDLEIDGDLVDDDFVPVPALVVRGDLRVRNWLRGGMPAFVGGSLQASGFVVGHYNDSALFVGGDLSASGYVRRAKPYPEFPDIAPHQVAGRVEARTIDLLEASDEALEAAFVEALFVEDGEDRLLDERAILERFNEGLPVWR